MATGTVTYGRCGALNVVPLSSVDYTLTVDLAPIPILSEWYAYVHVRGDDGLFSQHKLPNSYQIRFTAASGGITAELYQINAAGTENYRTTIGGITGGVAAGDTVRVKVEVSGTLTISLKVKAWKVGTTEPAYTDISSSVNVAYNGAFIGLGAQGGNNLVSENIQWDDLTVDALLIASTQTVQLPLVTSTPTTFAPTTVALVSLPLVTVPDPVVFAPTVGTNKLIILPLVLSPPTVFAPAVFRQGFVEMDLVTSTPTVFAPSVFNTTGTQTAVLPLVYANNTNLLLDELGVPIYDETGNAILIADDPSPYVGPPTAAIITGTQSPVLPFVTTSPTVYAPSVYQIARLPIVVVAEPTVYAPTVTVIPPIFLPLVVVPDPVVFAPSVITFGVQVLILPIMVVDDPVVFAPSVTLAITSVVTMDLLVVDDPVVFPPTVSIHIHTITYVFIPPHDEDGPRKLSEEGRRRAGVSRVANDLVGRYGAPRSFSVLKNGTTYRTVEGPDQADTLSADIYYAGGHEHEVSLLEKLSLEAAGFEVQTRIT